MQGGLAEGRELPHLVSLGSLYPQPLMVYTRSAAPIERLTELRGKRLAIPPEGSGARVLALKLLQANEMDKPPTVLDGAGRRGGATAARRREGRRRLSDGRRRHAAGDAQPARGPGDRARQLPPGRRLPAQVPFPLQAHLAGGGDGPGARLPAAGRSSWSARPSSWSRATICTPRSPTSSSARRGRSTAAPACSATPASTRRRWRASSRSAPTPSATTSPGSSSSTSGSPSGWPASSTGCWWWWCRCWWCSSRPPGWRPRSTAGACARTSTAGTACS